MTVNDFTHYAQFDKFLYIYKAPDSTGYTLQLTGSEIKDEVTSDSARFDVHAHLGWALIYKALEKVAELNGDEKTSILYQGKAEHWKNEYGKVSNRLNSSFDRVQPHSLI